jgi:hypothetical protein
MIPNLEEIYCLIDNLTRFIDKEAKVSKVGRKKKLSRSELLTISIIKQKIGIETNKQLYFLIKKYMKKDFSPMPSYQQFCSGLESNFWHLGIINLALLELNKQKFSEFFVIDSTPLPLCSVGYRFRSRLGKGLASSGKNMNGWYYGFKLHLIINENMEIVSFKFTNGSTSDITALDSKLVKGIVGYLIGDKGYLGYKKAKELKKSNITIITKGRKNMKKLPINKKILRMLSRRQIVEASFSMLKDRLQIINKKARSITSFFSQALSAILAYTIDNNKHILHLELNSKKFSLIS